MADFIALIIVLLFVVVPLVVGIGALYMLIYAAKSMKDAWNTPLKDPEKKEAPHE